MSGWQRNISSFFYFPLFNSNRYYDNDFLFNFTMFHVKCNLRSSRIAQKCINYHRIILAVSLLPFENERVEKSGKLTRLCFLLASPALLAWVFDQRKCEKEHNFDVWKAPPSQFKRQNYCPFSASPSAQHNKRHDMENLPTQNFLMSQRLLCCAQRTNNNWRLGLSAL